MPTDLPLFYQVHFYLFGLLAIASALAFVTRKSPVSAALWLVSVMFNLAALYIMLDAHFIGAIQVLVYAGAIMVVFLFVVMLLNLGHPDELSDIRGKWGRLAAGGLGLALLAQIMVLASTRFLPSLQPPVNPVFGGAPDRGAIGTLAQSLFNEHLLAFELTSILLLAAIVGAVALGKRRTGRVS
jgi:NADH-quinone oxidoreductase subunit J